MACPARGQVGEGNIRIHSRKRARYRCSVCGKTFSERAGTLFFRRRTDENTITRVVTLVSHGCPVVAIEAAFGFQAQTVREWVDAGGAHAEAVHHAQVVQPRDLHQVQADEIHVKTQAGVLWMAMADGQHAALVGGRREPAARSRPDRAGGRDRGGLRELGATAVRE